MKTSQELKKFKERMKRWPAPSEKAFSKRLDKAGIKYKKQIILGFYILDFVIPEKMICIEIDGPEHKKNSSYDAYRDAFVSAAGFFVIRVDNEDIETFDISIIDLFPSYPEKDFHAACWRAVGWRGAAINQSRRDAKIKESGQQHLL